jgi:hypothetical protein
MQLKIRGLLLAVAAADNRNGKQTDCRQEEFRKTIAGMSLNFFCAIIKTYLSGGIIVEHAASSSVCGDTGEYRSGRRQFFTAGGSPSSF